MITIIDGDGDEWRSEDGKIFGYRRIPAGAHPGKTREDIERLYGILEPEAPKSVHILTSTDSSDTMSIIQVFADEEDAKTLMGCLQDADKCSFYTYNVISKPVTR